MTNQNNKWIQYGAKRLEEANYVLTLESTAKKTDELKENNDTEIFKNDQKNDMLQCLEWIQQLERWFVKQCFHMESVWKKEKKELRKMFKNEFPLNRKQKENQSMMSC